MIYTVPEPDAQMLQEAKWGWKNEELLMASEKPDPLTTKKHNFLFQHVSDRAKKVEIKLSTTTTNGDQRTWIMIALHLVKQMSTVLDSGCVLKGHLSLNHLATWPECSDQTTFEHIMLDARQTGIHPLSQKRHTPVSWTVDTPRESLCRLWRWGGWCLLFHVTASWTQCRGASVWWRSKEKRQLKGQRVGVWLWCKRSCYHTQGWKSCFMAWLTSDWTSGWTRQHNKSVCLDSENPLSNYNS